jgi:hypothetical protein
MMRSGWLALAACLALVGCGGGSESAKTGSPEPVARKAAAKAPADETRRFPADGREAVEPVAAPLFGKDFLPGGNIAVYKKAGKSWKQFVIKNDDGGQTAVLLGKFKDSLKDPKFVAHMGGYFGMDGDQPVFVFPKGRWLAGTVGLAEKEADTAGRIMALRLD